MDQGLVADRSPNLPDDDVGTLGAAIGLGALKYAELSTDRIKDYVFDWDRMLAFDGNTATYLQYAHARIHSLLNRAGLTPTALHGSVFHISTRHERKLALRLLSYDGAVRETIERCAPYRLCASGLRGVLLRRHEIIRHRPGIEHPCPLLGECSVRERV